MSSGTWSLFGTEIPAPIVNETSLSINITNEGGYGGMTGLLKNIIGLWLIQESRRQWKREGEEYSYADLERMALSAEPFKCFIDPDSPEFTPPGDIPGRVREFCRKTGQYVPQTVGEIMRCIYESLAMKYRSTFSMIKECTGRDYPDIHVIGGGTKDTLLCQMTANACNVPVKAGPIGGDRARQYRRSAPELRRHSGYQKGEGDNLAQRSITRICSVRHRQMGGRI